ncbi:hypothetical protein A8H35_31930 [Burkholderia thailandensis]|nr:hypothetical protein A8H31_01865 [Burkholderia thailandensis]AWY62509.1 hypothetical protein A8H35_31930 [Burkholderia thailandensis]AWY66053.1 hypothetical protein A8H36_04145 [Burkholderia thailandensis]NOK42265.1 hypothetical protein [Burkholderia thailandensis]PHH33755.1 hypothetical protein CRX59_23955 [Burkholderia thailandensis]
MVEWSIGAEISGNKINFRIEAGPAICPKACRQGFERTRENPKFPFRARSVWVAGHRAETPSRYFP